MEMETIGKTLIGLSGHMGSGKDLVGKIIQYLTLKTPLDEYLFYKEPGGLDKHTIVELLSQLPLSLELGSDWKVKKFADKLKDITCLLIGCTREQLEDREYKEKELGENWEVFFICSKFHPNPMFNMLFMAHEEAVAYKKKHITTSLNSSGHEPYIEHRKLTPRLILQLLGTECGRNIIHPNIWVNALMSEYKPLNEKVQGLYLDAKGRVAKKENLSYPSWVITDMRFFNELKAVKDGEGITIRINRPGAVMDGIGYNANEHPSETALDQVEFDYVIDNDGTIEELIEKVKEILIKENIINGTI